MKKGYHESQCLKTEKGEVDLGQKLENNGKIKIGMKYV